MPVKHCSVLVMTDYYVPGYRGGGPIRSLSNLIDRLGEEFNFKVVTRDRDLGESEPYATIAPDKWQSVGNAEVLYTSPWRLSPYSLQRIISTAHHDILYLNSFFSPLFTISPLVLRRLGLIPEVPTILAPRGEFSSGALNIKPHKKRIYMAFANSSRLYDDITWQASSIYEESDIRLQVGQRARVKQVRVMAAPDLPSTALGTYPAGSKPKSHRRGPETLAFLLACVPKEEPRRCIENDV